MKRRHNEVTLATVWHVNPAQAGEAAAMLESKTLYSPCSAQQARLMNEKRLSLLRRLGALEMVEGSAMTRRHCSRVIYIASTRTTDSNINENMTNKPVRLSQKYLVKTASMENINMKRRRRAADSSSGEA